MTDTRHALAALLPCPFCGNSKGLAVANENPQDLSGGYFIACPSCDASTGLRFACGEDPIPLLIEQWNRRAALSAQPVAGAVATDETGWLIEHSGEILPGAEQRAQVSWLRVQMKFNGYGAREFGFTHDANEALRFARKEDAEAVLAMHLGASPPDWYSKPFSVTEHMWPDALQPQAAPATEPSAQPVAGAVAEPDCWAILTPNGSKLVSPDEAKGRKDAYPLYAAPQPQAAPAPEPSRSQKMHEAGFTARDTRLTCDECGAKFTRQFAPLHECAQPEPSAQALDIAFELGRVEAMQETSAFNASALRKALSAMLTHFGMDEDEWNKPTLDQARAALAEYDSFTLHPATADLVRRFSQALAEKLAAAEAKYGYSDGWASPDWMDECRTKLMEHIAKGDPRDVAAYCAFLWHHGASTARPEPSAQGRPCPFGCTTQEEHDAHQSAEPSAQGEAVAWKWRHFLGNPDVIEPFWTEWEPCTERQYQYALATPDHEGRALCEMPLASAPAAPAQACVTEEMVKAYLTANDAYWKRIDGEPTKLGKWRNGTPSEATRVSLMAALASAPSTPPPAVVEAVPLTDERGGYFSASLLASATMSDEAEGRAYRGYCPKCKHLTLVVKQRGNGLVFKGCAVCDSMVVLRDDA